MNEVHGPELDPDGLGMTALRGDKCYQDKSGYAKYPKRSSKDALEKEL